MQAIYHTHIWLLICLCLSVLPCMAQNGELLIPENLNRQGFGKAVAISGDVVAVVGGSSQHPVNNTEFPVVSVFRYNGSMWAFEANLFSEDSFSAFKIEDAIAIEDNRIAVGAADVGSGAVVFFEYDGTQWIEQGQVFHTSTTSGFEDNFGSTIALTDNFLAVPNTRERSASGNLETLPQQTYLYQHDGATWLPVDTLRVSDDVTGTAFGASVASWGNYLILGDPLYSTSGTSREGTAYLFENDGAAWSLKQQLDGGSDMDPDDRLGTSVAIDNTTIAVGAIRDSVGSVIQTGAVYVFKKQGEQWVKTDRLTASDGEEADYFGTSLALDGDDMIIGAPNRFHPSLINAGGYAYYFRYDGSAWVEHAKISLPDAASNDQFGWSVDVDNGWAVIGAYGRELGSNATGEVYMYKLADLVNMSLADTPITPVAFEIASSVYPNPFSTQVTLNLEMQNTERVHVGVYDVLGRQVAVLIDEVLPVGKHERIWKGSANHASGVYFFRATTQTATAITSGLYLGRK